MNMSKKSYSKGEVHEGKEVKHQSARSGNMNKGTINPNTPDCGGLKCYTMSCSL